MWGIPILDTIVGKVGDYFIEGKKQKTIKLEQAKEIALKEHEVKVKVADAKIELAKNGQMQEYDLDRISTENMSKSYFDEFLIMLLMIPVVLSFFPQYVAVVVAGFTALKLMPAWYMYLVIGAYVVKLGMRGLLTKLLSSKMSLFKGK